MNKNKSGFISMTLVYTFLIVFMFLMLAILRAYTEKDKYLEAINSQIDNDISANKQSRSYLIYELLENNSIQNYEKIKFVIPSNDEYGNGNGLFYIDNKDITDENNDGKSNRIYFFRGSVDNNFVVYNNNCYRIIRTNEDGSIRMIYSGPAIAKRLGSYNCNNIQKNLQNSNYNVDSIIDYYDNLKGTYDTSDVTINTNTALDILSHWYVDNVENNTVENLISINTKYCNNKEKYDVDSIYYKSKSMIPTFINPDNKDKYNLNNVRNSFSLKCRSEYLYPTSINSFIKPIGLLTAEDILLAGGYLTNDEDEFMGGNVGIINKKFYLFYGIDIWTSTPFYSDEDEGFVVGLNNNGFMSEYNVNDVAYFIPVISLKSNAKVISGNGNSLNPYVIYRRQLN